MAAVPKSNGSMLSGLYMTIPSLIEGRGWQVMSVEKISHFATVYMTCTASIVFFYQVRIVTVTVTEFYAETNIPHNIDSR